MSSSVLAASGTTPFVRAGMRAAARAGAWTCGIANNPGSPLLGDGDLGIVLDTGPEILTGSTRLKARRTGQSAAFSRTVPLAFAETSDARSGLYVGYVSGRHRHRGADLNVVGENLHCRYLGLASTPFDDGLRDRVVAAMPPGLPGARELCELHADLGEAYADAFAAAGDELAGGRADLAVLHGQTFYHWVDQSGRVRGTLQLGNSSAVAERLGVPVVSDLRSRDIAAGGQGAPLVPVFDASDEDTSADGCSTASRDCPDR